MEDVKEEFKERKSNKFAFFAAIIMVFGLLLYGVFLG